MLSRGAWPAGIKPYTHVTGGCGNGTLFVTGPLASLLLACGRHAQATPQQQSEASARFKVRCAGELWEGVTVDVACCGVRVADTTPCGPHALVLRCARPARLRCPQAITEAYEVLTDGELAACMGLGVGCAAVGGKAE